MSESLLKQIDDYIEKFQGSSKQLKFDLRKIINNFKLNVYEDILVKRKLIFWINRYVEQFKERWQNV